MDFGLEGRLGGASPARPLRIGLIAPPWFAVPPAGYGGIELVVSYLADGLTARGHEVTLFAAGGSRTSARLVTTFPEPQSAVIGDPLVECRHVFDAYSQWREFDIIHDHTTLGLLTGHTLPIPVVHTLHGPITGRTAPVYERFGESISLIAISRHQRSTLPASVRATVIHNGLDMGPVPFRGTPGGDYLLFVGRMSPEKGVAEAVEIARQAGKPLLILAKINEDGEKQYFRDEVQPRMRGVDVELREHTPPDEKYIAYRDALATLFPIQWPEPFGLVMIESMATGTPVIAMRNGSSPEVIEHGVTGFVCDSIDESVEAVTRVGSLDRWAARDRVERLFSAEANINQHEELYRSLVYRSSTIPDLGLSRISSQQGEHQVAI